MKSPGCCCWSSCIELRRSCRGALITGHKLIQRELNRCSPALQYCCWAFCALKPAWVCSGSFASGFASKPLQYSCCSLEKAADQRNCNCLTYDQPNFHWIDEIKSDWPAGNYRCELMSSSERDRAADLRTDSTIDPNVLPHRRGPLDRHLLATDLKADQPAKTVRTKIY